MARLTVLIPTHNRADLLAALLRATASQMPFARVMVLDSSAPETAQANAAAAAAFENVSHHPFDASEGMFAKLGRAAAWVETPFCMIAADDDLFLPDRLEGLMEALEAVPEAVAAQGLCFNARRRDARTLEAVALGYAGPSLSEPDAADRLRRFIPNYEALTYAVCRTEAAQRALAAAARQRTVFSAELAHTLALVALGGFVRTGSYTHARLLDSTIGYDSWHPLEYMTLRPFEFFGDFTQCRDAIQELMAAEHDEAAVEPLDSKRRALDVVFLCYLRPFAASRVAPYATTADFQALPRAEAVEHIWTIWNAEHSPFYLRRVKRSLRLKRMVRRFLREKTVSDFLHDKLFALTDRKVAAPCGALVRVRRGAARTADHAPEDSFADFSASLLGVWSRALAPNAALAPEATLARGASAS